jgi:hypothetical protein
LKATADTGPTWRSHKLKEWAGAQASSLILIKGYSSTRHETKDFAADIVGLLRRMKFPVVWTLSAREETENHWRSPIDILKQLVLQLLHLNHSLLDKQSPTLNAARFQSATTESEWFGILGSVLEGLPQIYIAIDAEVLSRKFSTQLSWPDAFLEVFKNLKEKGCKTVVKVVLVSLMNNLYMRGGLHSQLGTAIVNLDKQRRPPPMVRRRPRYRAAARRAASEVLRPYLLHKADSMS